MPVQRTDLFPTKLEIKQHNVGDCYLLATLDAIFESEQFLKKLQSMFKINDDGTVTVCFKHSNISKNLNIGSAGLKNNFERDEEAKEDRFTLSVDRIKEISTGSNESTQTVETNSLAIKILERLSSYYYNTSDQLNGDPLASVQLHNQPGRLDITSSQFVAKLFNLNVDDRIFNIDGPFIKHIEALKLLREKNPDHPIYLSMSYGKADQFGNYPYRHAFRVKRIESSNGGSQFILVNPWDNQGEESYSFDEIIKRKGRLSVFYLDEQQQKQIHEVKTEPKNILITEAQYREDVNLAIQEKAKQLPPDQVDEARLEVELGLIKYSLTSYIRFVSRSGGLRDKVENDQGYVDAIRKYTPASTYFAKACNLWISGEETPQGDVGNYLSTIDSTTITDDFFSEFPLYTKDKDLYSVYEGIWRLSKINPKLSEKLGDFVLNHYSLSDFIAVKGKALSIIDGVVEKINNNPVNTDELLKNIQLIQFHQWLFAKETSPCIILKKITNEIEKVDTNIDFSFWPYSSIHRFIASGMLPEDWGGKTADGSFGE